MLPIYVYKNTLWYDLIKKHISACVDIVYIYQYTEKSRRKYQQWFSLRKQVF